MAPVAVTQLLALISLTVALDNGLLKTPPMGWMAWERFRCEIDCKNDPENCIRWSHMFIKHPLIDDRIHGGFYDGEPARSCCSKASPNHDASTSMLHSCESLFRDMADRLAEDGWKELGYEYVIIDDCWMSKLRDEQGRLQPEPSRFPGGIAKLAKYIHDRGLKLGIYADIGTQTCMGFPGTTLDKIEIDAQTFASWGVDYLKFDGCSSNSVEQMLGYPLMSKALNATGRPMAFSCSWPVYVGGLPPNVNYSFLGDICNLWRNYYDIQDSWDSVQGIVEWFSNNQDDLQPAAGPGRWNDPDMLIIGNFGLSKDQACSQMALWAIMAAPLIMSTDLRNLDKSATAILQNKVAIAINQDPMGIQGRRLLQEKSQIEVFWRPLSQSASALVFLSRRTDMPYLYHTCLAKLNYDAGNYEAYDVFTGSTVMGLNATTEFTVSINPSGVVMWYVYPEEQSKQTETLHY